MRLRGQGLRGSDEGLMGFKLGSSQTEQLVHVPKLWLHGLGNGIKGGGPALQCSKPSSQVEHAYP